MTPDAPLPVVMLSKAMGVGAYQRKAELMAATGALDLTVLVPWRWRESGGARAPEAVHTRGYRLRPTAVRRPGAILERWQPERAQRLDYHLHSFPGLGQDLDTYRPAVLHIDEEAYNLAAFLALRAALRRGIRTLFFSWQNLARRYPPPFANIEAYVHRRADGAIAGSQGAAQVLRAKGFRGPLWVLPQFGVDEAAFSPPWPDPRHDSPLEPRPLRLGYAGRLVAEKGLDLLLEALARLNQPWRLDIVGEGPRRKDLERQAGALGLTDRVAIHPWLPSLAMPDFYRGIDVLVLPSRSTASWKEQFGRVLTEAMACGAVCVGADSGEIGQVLGEAGLTFREGDAGELAGILERLAGDAGLRRRLSEAGRARVLAYFTMRHIAERTVSIYRQVAGIEPMERAAGWHIPSPGR